ncbi:hypothetical protein ABTL90_19500, partial [Acinetobacter baumannii]
IPILAIVTSHQRKMTELIHRNQTGAENPLLGQMYAQMQQLQAEVAHLRDRLNQIELAKDDLSSRLSAPSVRVGQESGGNGEI